MTGLLLGKRGRSILRAPAEGEVLSKVPGEVQLPPGATVVKLLASGCSLAVARRVSGDPVADEPARRGHFEGPMTSAGRR